MDTALLMALLLALVWICALTALGDDPGPAEEGGRWTA